MHIAIIGSGPVGMTAAMLLARQRHQVTLVDRDPGPVAGRAWNRVGVMQFHLPHGVRSQCRAVLADRLPDVLDAVLAAGAQTPEGTPANAAALRVRRSVLERTLWECATAEPGVHRLTGHVDDIEVQDGRATGIVVDSAFVGADLVVDAGGRAGRRSTAFRPPGQRADCGMAYASRIYRLRPGESFGPMNGGPGYLAVHQGFMVFVFLHDAGTFTVLFVRPSDDTALAALRHVEAFDAACRAVPGLSDWVDPERSHPIDVVRAGAGLTNEYRAQPTPAGLVAIGDAFCVTNPQGARGLALGLESAAVLADLVAAGADVAAGMDDWGRQQLLPWYHDHLIWDASLLGRWAGRPVTADGPIGLDVLIDAAQERHPEWMGILGPFFGMQLPPAAVEPLREAVREMVCGGWQPPNFLAPGRGELAAVIESALSRPVSA